MYPAILLDILLYRAVPRNQPAVHEDAAGKPLDQVLRASTLEYEVGVKTPFDEFAQESARGSTKMETAILLDNIVPAHCEGFIQISHL